MDCALERPPPPFRVYGSAGKPDLLVNLRISALVWSQLSCDLLSDLRLINSCNWEHTRVLKQLLSGSRDLEKRLEITSLFLLWRLIIFTKETPPQLFSSCFAFGFCVANESD